MQDNIDKVNAIIDSIYDHIIDIRHTIHEYPELGGHEEMTEKLISVELDKAEIDYTDHICGHGIISTIHGKDNSLAVAVRGDMDALPITEKTQLPFSSKVNGVMHACGHDIHTAVLLATALVLKTMENELPYSVKLFFQPSEETTGGARQMIDAGCMKNPDVTSIVALHVLPSLPCGHIRIIPGYMNASSTEFNVIIKGKTCHGAHPDMGTDTIVATCDIIMSLQTIISRQISPTAPALITVGQICSGSAGNIISGETHFNGIIRAFDIAVKETVKINLKHMCENIASAYNVSAYVSFCDGYPSLKNDDGLLSLVKTVAENAIGADKVHITNTPSLGCDDFAYFCNESKGLYFNLGTKMDSDTDPSPIHSETFNPDENCIRTGVLIEVLSVLRLLEEKL